MEEIFGLEGYKKVNSFNKTEKVPQVQQKELILFQLPPEVFDRTLLSGLEIDLQDPEIQVFTLDDFSFGVSVQNEEIGQYIGQQVVPIFQNDGLLQVGQPITKLIKVFKYNEVPEVKKTAIKKSKPISYQEKKKVKKMKLQ